MTDELAGLVVRATIDSDNPEVQRDRTRALAALLPVLAKSAKESGVRAVAAGRWLADEVLELAPKLPARDAAALRAQHPALPDAQIAQRLIKNATRTTAALGAAAGGLAAVEFISPPLLFAAPIQIAAQTIAVTSVELKLVAELHEVLGRAAQGSLTERGSAYLMLWVRQRAVSAQVGGVGIGAVFGVAAKRQLRSRLFRRLGRNATSLAPFLAGALVGAEVNRRITKELGQKLFAELQGMAEERWSRSA